MASPSGGLDRKAPDLLVGEIRAVRTFRLDSDGVLWPAFFADSAPWTDGPNTARCSREHTPAAPECTCGFYAYGSLDAAQRQYSTLSRQVLAVVACWGRVVPATLGLRAQHARIEAIWVSRARVSRHRARLLRRQYPSAAICRSRRDLLRKHPLTRLDCYSPHVRRSPIRGLMRNPFDRGLGYGCLGYGLCVLAVLSFAAWCAFCVLAMTWEVVWFIVHIILRIIAYLH